MKQTIKVLVIGVVLAGLVMGARSEEPMEAISGGIARLKEKRNYTWSVSSVPGGEDTTPQFYIFPTIHGTRAGGVTLLTPRFGGEVEMFLKGDRKAARITTHWKAPEDFRLDWLRKSYEDLHGIALEPGASPPPGANGLGQVNPVDAQALYLGEDPTAIAGGITPLPSVNGRRGRMAAPRAGASIYAATNAPATELPDPSTMTIMLLDAAPDPLEQAETILRGCSNFKTVGAGSFTGDLSSEFIKSLSESRKRIGDNRAPEIKDAKCVARFWTSQKLLIKYQVVVQASMMVGPTYNPLTVVVDRTVTVEFRGAGSTRVVLPAGAVKLLE
jgi:hypothetical protein